MQIQRTHLQQSAAASLMAALAKGDRTDDVSFQQQFAETIDAVAPRRQTPQRRDDQSSRDVVDSGRSPEASGGRRAEPDDRPARDGDRSTTGDAADDAAPLARSDRSRVSAEAREPAADDPAEVQPESAGPEVAQDAPTPESPQVEQTAAAQGNAAPVVQPRREVAEAQALLSALAARNPVDVAIGAGAGAGVGAERPTDEATPATAPGPNANVQAVRIATANDAAVEELPVGNQPVTIKAGPAAPEDEADGPLKATRIRVQRPEARPVPAGERQPTGDKPEADAGKDTNRQTPAPTVQRADLGGQQVKAQVVSVTLTSSAVAESAEASSEQDTAKVAGAAPMSNRAMGPLLRSRADGPTADQTEQIERIARVIRASIGRGGSRVSLQLDPPELGRLRVQMQIRGADVIARFETQTDAARLWLEQSLGHLREGLSSGGIRLVEATVETHGSEGEAPGGQTGEPGQFTAGNDSGAGQSHDQPAPWGAAETETDVPQWAEVPAGQDTLDVVA